MIDETARIGAHNTQVAFLHPKSGGGVFMSCVRITGGEKMTDIYENINELYDRRREVEAGGGYERIIKKQD